MIWEFSKSARSDVNIDERVVVVVLLELLRDSKAALLGANIVRSVAVSIYVVNEASAMAERKAERLYVGAVAVRGRGGRRTVLRVWMIP